MQVHQHHGHVQIPDGGEHIVGGGVGQQLDDDQIHIRSPELVTGSGGQLLGGDDAAVDQLDRIRQGLLEGFVLALKFGHQTRELGKISPQRDGKYTDSGFGFD